MRDGLFRESSGVSLRAAQYLRMSTDEQYYSTLNQAEAIAGYAAAHNIEVVRTYSDDARSGLQLNGRPGLKLLLSDVEAGKANFDVILVYDVSRWGRFQDADESAYYEYLCKKCGVPVVYCTEDFKNDGSLVSTIIKALQRAEAADYSRRLSVKVFAGHCTLSRRGFWQGSSAGYGLRRVLIDASGCQRTILADGERKFIQSDRVILKPGPAYEVDVARRMFKSFALEGKNEVQIAKELNEEGSVNQYGRAWNRSTISKLLCSEKYMGHNVYNRTSCKLKSKAMKNPPEKWIRSANAFEAVVDPTLFLAAQNRFAELTRRKSDQCMLENLNRILKAKGLLNSKIINGAESTPRVESYKKRFGSLVHAYELIDYRPKKFGNAAAKRKTSLKRKAFLSVFFAEMHRLGLTVRFDFRARHYVVNNKFTAQIYMLQCLQAKGAKPQWILRQRRRSSIDLIIAARMSGAEDIHDYVLLRDVCLSDRLNGTGEDVERLGAINFQTIGDLARALERIITSPK